MYWILVWFYGLIWLPSFGAHYQPQPAYQLQYQEMLLRQPVIAAPLPAPTPQVIVFPPCQVRPGLTICP